MYAINERLIAAPAAIVGALLDRLASDDDAVWPATTWPALRLDRPLGVGADGGHGPVRYLVEAYEPGHRIRFSFTPKFRIDGYHELTVEPVTHEQSRLRDVLSGRACGSMRLAWPLVWRPLHDALMEDLLDRAEAEATGRVRQPARWSGWVWLLRRLLAPSPTAVSVPADAALLRAAFAGMHSHIEDADLVDAWAVPLRPGVPSDAASWTDAMFGNPPRWVVAVRKLRNRLVGLIGIKSGDESTFDPLAQTPAEVLMGSDDTHLDFRVSVLVSGRTVVVSSVARTHNRRGRLYLGVIRRAHPVVVRAMLARASRCLASRASAV